MLLVMATGLPLTLLARDPSRQKVKRWAMQVALGAEFGSDKKVVSRWERAPSVSVFGATPAQKAVIEEVFATLKPVLEPVTGRILMLRDEDDRASMKIYFADLADLPKIAREKKIGYEEDNWGFCWMEWNGGHVVTSSYVLLAGDKLKGRSLRHFAYEEIIQSFGLATDSDEFEDSIFFARGEDGGRAERPSSLDLALLHWLYRYVQPGDDKEAFSKRFDQTWPER